jgi:hypothetical protein
MRHPPGSLGADTAARLERFVAARTGSDQRGVNGLCGLRDQSRGQSVVGDTRHRRKGGRVIRTNLDLVVS